MLQYITLAPPGGMALEFGVASGSSTRLIAEWVRPRVLYGFDSFAGLPEDWTDAAGEMHNRKGTFACEPPSGLPDNVVLIKGLFQDTLPGFLVEHLERVAFVHVDSDLYSSAMFVLRTLGPRLDRAIMVFDEYGGHPAYEHHEGRAVRDFVQETGYRFERLDAYESVVGVFRVHCS